MHEQCNVNYKLISLLTDLASRHRNTSLPELLIKFKFIEQTDSESHTPADKVLSRVRLELIKQEHRLA